MKNLDLELREGEEINLITIGGNKGMSMESMKGIYITHLFHGVSLGLITSPSVNTNKMLYASKDSFSSINMYDDKVSTRAGACQ